MDHGLGRWVRRAQMGSAIRDSWCPLPFHYLGCSLVPLLGHVDPADVLSMFPLLPDCYPCYPLIRWAKNNHCPA